MRASYLRRGLLAAALVGLALWAGLSPAQNQVGPAPDRADKPKAEAPAAAPKGDKAKEDERITIEWVDALTRDGDVYHLRGNVIFVRRDMKLYCDEADYDEKADTAKARGHLRITDPNSVVTGDLLEADFGKELAIVTGSVTVVTQKKGNKTTSAAAEPSLEKPGKGAATKPPGGERNASGAKASPTADKRKRDQDQEPERLEEYWEKKSTITCERLEYYYADDVKKMIATPRVKAVQEDRTAWADRAVYEDIPRLLTLTGNVAVKTEKGDEMHCAKAVIWVDEDRVEAQGVTGVTLRKKQGEEPKPTPATPAPSQPAPAPTPPKPAPVAQPAPGP